MIYGFQKKTLPSIVYKTTMDYAKPSPLLEHLKRMRFVSGEHTVQCGFVAEIVAYDLVLEVAKKVQGILLLLHGPWKWLLMEFASYHGVSGIYTKLSSVRIISFVHSSRCDFLNLNSSILIGTRILSVQSQVDWTPELHKNLCRQWTS